MVKQKFHRICRIDETNTRTLAEKIAKRRKQQGFKPRLTKIKSGFRVYSCQKGAKIIKC